MSNLNSGTEWEFIQQSINETEKLLVQKKYNLSMIKARQTLEYMVKYLSPQPSSGESDLIDIIDDLYKRKIISKSTCENYHKIRMIGNKAIHENDNNAYNANKAYTLLSQEVTFFANDLYTKKAGRKSAHTQRSSTTKSKSSQRIKRKRRPRPLNLVDIMKFIIPILLLILLIVAIRFFKNRSSSKETLATETSTVTIAETTLAVETTAAETEPVSITYVTTSALNVRSSPSTAGTKIATLPAGTVVDYVRAHDNDWAIINYDGAQAYVASAYLAQQ